MIDAADGFMMMAERALKQRDELVKALEDIKAATLNGSVCPDVAWFGPGETLHDFCERILDHVGSPGEQK